MTTARLGLFAMFGRLAEPPEPRTGAWRIKTDDGREGVVLMEAGRICWANHELVGRLSDEIERRYGVSRTAIEQVIRQCREQRQPFAASLVDHGYLTEPQLTSVLRDHTCRSILLLVKSGVRDCEWLPHQAGGYAPGTTISVTQAACYCVATVKGVAAEKLEAALEDMLAGDESAGQFTGGTVYQAFLSATNYHRWHSPVAGTIVRAFTREGTYYSEADSEGPYAVEPRYSQSYRAHVAARAVILIEADNPVIGLTAFVPVGMSEVSSCMIDPRIQPGYHVAKGEELVTVELVIERDITTLQAQLRQAVGV